jgi:hypothetical protein
MFALHNNGNAQLCEVETSKSKLIVSLGNSRIENGRIAGWGLGRHDQSRSRTLSSGDT